MRKTKSFYLGDKVKTNKNFKPLDDDDKEIKVDKYPSGTIVSVAGDCLLVDFGEDLGYTNYLGGILPFPTGYAVNSNEIDTEAVSTDKQEDDLIRALRGLAYESFLSLPKEIEDSARTIKNRTETIERLYKDAKEQERLFTSENRHFKELKERQKNLPTDDAKIMKQFKKLLSHPKISSIEVAKDDLIVTTEELTFTDKTRDLPVFNLGAFKIKINTKSFTKDGVSIINYKKHFQSGEYHHPCVNSYGKVCMGGNIQRQVGSFLNTKSYIQLIHLMIGFLEEPNYGTPYLDAKLFYCAQPVTIRPRTVANWFDRSYWRDNQPWDSTLYTAESKEASAKYTGRKLPGAPAPLEEVECPNCGTYTTLEFCPECEYEL